MSDALIFLSKWLHMVATVALLGFYSQLGIVYLPFLIKHFKGVELGTALDEISDRFLAWIIAALIVFAVTGTYMMVSEDSYTGLGHLFANTWTILIVSKHVLVLFMAVLGVWITFAVKKGVMAVKSDAPSFEPLNRIRWMVALMNISALLVLLLTALAQKD